MESKKKDTEGKYNNFQNMVTEIIFNSTILYEDPFNDIELDVIFKTPSKEELVVPAFLAGDSVWKVRYSSFEEGIHSYATRCTDGKNSGLNNKKGIVTISKYKGKNRLYKHGPVNISRDNRHLEYLDGKSFLWLGDTWWHGLTKRCKWPDDFKMLTKDRADKGFSVIQIIAGLYFDSQNFNQGGSNEAGWPWDKDFKTINPAYFDLADLKINWLVESGLVPCIFGAWGFHLHYRGIEKMKKHWRYLIARWGAYPVIWCVAGEAKLIYKWDIDDYTELHNAMKEQQKGWVEVTKHLRSIDPYKHLVTVHPSPAGDESASFSSRDIFEDSDLFDIDLLQTGHYGRRVLEFTLQKVQESLNSKPIKPVINSEVLYEGIMGSNWQQDQRFLFWTHMLMGTAGHTYGAQGLFYFNTNEIKSESLEDTQVWGDYIWTESYKFKGSYQLGIGKKFLEQFEWFKFEHHPGWVSPHWSNTDRMLPYAAGIPGKIRIIYIPGLYFFDDSFTFKEIKIMGIEKDIKYNAYFFNPRTGKSLEKMNVPLSEKGIWTISTDQRTCLPTMEDWVLVMKSEK